MKKTYQRPTLEFDNLDIQDLMKLSYTEKPADSSTVLGRESRFSTWEDDVEE